MQVNVNSNLIIYIMIKICIFERIHWHVMLLTWPFAYSKMKDLFPVIRSEAICLLVSSERTPPRLS